MEKINADQNLQMRYQRLRNVIERLNSRERQYSQAVLEKFEDLDIEGIELLAKRRQRDQRLRERLQWFLDSYEHKNW